MNAGQAVCFILSLLGAFVTGFILGGGTETGRRVNDALLEDDPPAPTEQGD